MVPCALYSPPSIYGPSNNGSIFMAHLKCGQEGSIARIMRIKMHFYPDVNYEICSMQSNQKWSQIKIEEEKNRAVTITLRQCKPQNPAFVYLESKTNLIE
jgi:predicted RNA-binding protein with PUA-like domain